VINLGEVYYRIWRSSGTGPADGFWNSAFRGQLPVTPVEATRTRVRRAAALKGSYRMACADAFAVQTAIEMDVPLVTGDPEIREAERQEGLRVEWLPRRGR